MNNFFRYFIAFLKNKFIQHQKDVRKSSYNFRVIFIYFCFTFLLLAVGVRIIYFKVNSFNVKKNADNHLARGQIVDSQNNVLAFSETRYNVYFNGKKSNIQELDIVNLIDTFNLKREKLEEFIADRKVVLLKRFASKNYVQEVLKINQNNLLLIDKVEYRRYPYKNLLAQTLGFVGYDGEGLSGLELEYNDVLEYNPDEIKSKKIAININKDFQRELELILQKAVIQNGAKAGTIIVQEIYTGKVVGIANYPTFDLNQFNSTDKRLFRDLSVSTIIDPGSIFKAIFSAYLMEKHNVDPTEKKYHCKGYYELKNGEIIKCNAHHGDVSLEDIIKFSCNAGIIQATEVISNEEMYAFLKKLFIGEKLGVDLPSEVKSQVPPLEEWGLRTRATIPIGHGIAVSPLQLSAIFSAFIGNGNMMQPQIIKGVQLEQGYQQNDILAEPKVLAKILKEETTSKLVDLLVLGTLKGSTGSGARNTGLEEVFGKTGTSQLVNYTSGGYYTDRYHSTFAGGYPVSSPKYSILIVINTPKKEYYGGKVAAPLYAQVVEKLIFHYRLPNERVIQKYDQQLIQQNIYNENVVELFGDLVPNFSNLSLRNSLVLFGNLKKASGKDISINTEGIGYAYKQIPRANSSVTNNAEITIYFR